MRNELEKQPAIKRIDLDWSIRQVKAVYDSTALDAERVAKIVRALYPAEVKDDRAYEGPR